MKAQSCVPLILIIVAGCSRDPRIPELASALGVVTYQGEPLADATVTFVSTETEKGYQPGIGSTNDRGEFRIRSYEYDGAIVGSHKIVVFKLDASTLVIDPKTQKPVPMMDKRWKKPKLFIPAKYTQPEMSGLTAKVESGKKNQFTFELKDE